MERAQIPRRYRGTGDDQPFRGDQAMRRTLCRPFLPIHANDVDSKDTLDRRREFDLSWSSPAQMLDQRKVRSSTSESLKTMIRMKLLVGVSCVVALPVLARRLLLVPHPVVSAGTHSPNQWFASRAHIRSRRSRMKAGSWALEGSVALVVTAVVA